jgi:hypothetical protein
VFYSLVDQKFTGPAGFEARGASKSRRERRTDKYGEQTPTNSSAEFKGMPP